MRLCLIGKNYFGVRVDLPNAVAEENEVNNVSVNVFTNPAADLVVDKILGVPKSATKAEIKKAFKRLARKYHPDINKEEVEDYKWMTLAEVKSDIEQNPNTYTEWFKIIFDKSYEKLTNA